MANFTHGFKMIIYAGVLCLCSLNCQIGQSQIVLSEDDKKEILGQLKKEMIDSLKKQILDSIKNEPAVRALLLDENQNAYKKPQKSEPFAWGDFTWTQGNNRQKKTHEYSLDRTEWLTPLNRRY